MSCKTVVLLVVGILGATYVGLCRVPFPISSEWQTIHPGQLRTEVLAKKIPAFDTQLMDAKQFDQSWRFHNSPVFGHVSQYLIVRYDTWRPEKARVTSVEVKTITERFDLFRNHFYTPITP